jgi:cytochrome c oxidase subunit 2
LINRVSFALCALAAAGCSGPQSSLDPAGPAAASIHLLGLIMYAGATAVTLLVTALMLVPVWRGQRSAINRGLFLWGGGVALPGLTLAALVPYTMLVGGSMRQSTAPGHVSIDVTGFIYWWDVAYRDPPGGGVAITANELRIPVGEPVELFLRSADVIHSFWVPSLAGKTDNIPGYVNRMVIQADRPGVYRGQCAEYCGDQHAWMAFEVIAVSRPEFDAWLLRLAAPVTEPANEQLRRGRDLFVRAGCGSCHAVRGLTSGRLGPDLTQVGARNLIGGGVLPGGLGNIAGWIASAQHIKPGNLMPSFGHLPGPDLRALAAYLESLK